MKLLKLIVERKILLSLIVVLVGVIGGYSLFKLDKELMPTIAMDGAYVQIDAGELSAIEVERNITTPIEQRLKGIDGIETIHSTTYIGQSIINMTFANGRGAELQKEVETIVHATTAETATVTNVIVQQYGSSQGYEFFMDISDGDMAVMTDFAKNVLKPRLEALPEVKDVALSGTLNHEIVVEFDQGKLTKSGLNVQDVIHTIQQVNAEATLGELQEDQKQATVRWNTKFAELNKLKELNIQTQTGFIPLQDLAEISVQPLESSSFVWKDGTKDLIFIQIGRVSNVTQIDMAEAIRTEIATIRDEKLINGFELNEMVAQADYVKDAIDGVSNNILIGAIIAIAVLLLFLRNIRTTFIIGISIPTSVLLTVCAMWLFNYSFNLLTLIGLGLGIGMMVDSSIVILESIYRKREQGLNKFQAVLEGTKEVASAVIASMLTTIVVFLPIGLVGGDLGQYILMLSVVVTFTLISSVIVAFTVIPALSEKLLKLRTRKKIREEGVFLKNYSKLVNWTIKKKRHSFMIITLFFLLFVSSLFLVTNIPMNVMPDFFNRYTEIMIEVEPGLSTEEKAALTQKMNSKLNKVKDVETNYIMDEGGVFYAIINMTKGDQITTEQKQVNEEILQSLRELQDTEPILNVISAMDGGGGSAVQVRISGEDFAKLQTTGDDLSKELATIDGIVGVRNSMERTSQEKLIKLKDEEIESAGLSQLDVKHFIEQAFLQMPIGEMTYAEKNIPLTVKWSDQTTSLASLLDTQVPTQKGEKTLSTFIEFTNVHTPNEISHTDGERFISISADIEGRDLGAVSRDIQALIKDFSAPNGYTVGVAGELKEQQELMTDMIFVLLIALFLVYLVMAVQFNHLGHPLIVMSIIPMTIVGVILGLFITQMELNLLSGMGIIMLIGIVLNNAILLIDRTNQLRKEGFSVQTALVEAGKNRVRPIFMTTLTTVGGMLPLALAADVSGNYQAPLATVIIFGLLFSTLITLLLIPAVYRLCTVSEQNKSRVRKRNLSTEVLQANE